MKDLSVRPPPEASPKLSETSNVTSRQRDVLLMLVIAAAGGALEFYDFVIFIFLADVISLVFFPPSLPYWLVLVETFGIFAAGYIFRPLGGVVLAHYGDLFGRKQVFAFSILLMAVSTMAVAVLPGYDKIGIAAPISLLMLRILQGIAIGGEVPGAWTFVAEHVSPRRAGFACGLVCVGLNLGTLIGALGVTATAFLLSPAENLSFGWRIPFLFGGVFGLIAVQLRKMLHETPVFEELQAQSMLVPELPLRVVLRTHTRGVIISMLCTWILSASVLMLTLMVPAVLEQVHHFSRASALVAASVSTLSLTVGVICAGVILDRIGPGKLFVVGGLLLAVGTYAFNCMIQPTPFYVYIVSAVMGFSGALAGAVPFVMIACFPPSVRFTGVSFSFNVSYAVFGGLTPVGLAALLSIDPRSHIYYLLFISCLSVLLGCYFLVAPPVSANR